MNSNSSTEQFTNRWWLSAALLLTSLVVFLWCLSEYRAARRNLSVAAENLEECQDLGAKIAAWNTRPLVASLDATSSQELTQQITACVRQANIPARALKSISPMDSVRLGNTDYKQRQTQVRIDGIELGRLSGFQSALNEREGLYLRDLILTPGEGTNASIATEVWDARLTLTQLIYSPTSQ
ncbi:MAG: hypothetical protein AAF483_12175 [Planctomycetota bacterium]